MSGAQINQRTASRNAGFRSWNLILVLSLTAGVALRIYSLLRESAIGDELFCRRLTLMPWKQNFQAVAKDIVTPPLHYLTYKAWSGLVGHGLMELRVLALLFGLAVIVGTVLLGKYLFRDKRVAVLAGVLVAGNDMQVLFSHFARHYTMFSAIVLALMATFWCAFQNPRNWLAWIAFSGLGTILVYTHYVGWLYLFGLFLIIPAKHFRVLWKRFLMAVSIPAALFIPWLLLISPYYRSRGLEPNLGWITTPSVRVLPELIAKFSGLPGTYSNLLILLTVGIFAIVIFGLVSGKKSFADRPYPANQALLLLAGMTVIPPLALFLLARPPLDLPIWGFRHLLPSQAPWALLTAVGIMSIARLKKRPVTLFATILAVSLQWFPAIRNTARLRFFPLSGVTSYLQEVSNETDNIYTFSAPGRRSTINYHLGDAGSVKPLPENLSELPVAFWGIYDPGSETDRGKMILLEKLGYTSRQARHFTHPRYSRKQPDNLEELRIVLLSLVEEPMPRIDNGKE